jgi:hypothetical protein
MRVLCHPVLLNQEVALVRPGARRLVETPSLRKTLDPFNFLLL